jgi:hypothetical protein
MEAQIFYPLPYDKSIAVGFSVEFDGDPVIATKKGVNPPERGSQVHFMAEAQAMFDFPLLTQRIKGSKGQGRYP